MKRILKSNADGCLLTGTELQWPAMYGNLQTHRELEGLCQWEMQVLTHTQLSHPPVLQLAGGGGIVCRAQRLEVPPSGPQSDTIPSPRQGVSRTKRWSVLK